MSITCYEEMPCWHWRYSDWQVVEHRCDLPKWSFWLVIVVSLLSQPADWRDVCYKSFIGHSMKGEDDKGKLKESPCLGWLLWRIMEFKLTDIPCMDDHHIPGSPFTFVHTLQRHSLLPEAPSLQNWLYLHIYQHKRGVSLVTLGSYSAHCHWQCTSAKHSQMVSNSEVNGWFQKKDDYLPAHQYC